MKMVEPSAREQGARFQMTNRFLLVSKPGNRVQEWDVHKPPPTGYPHDCGYFGRILALTDLALAGAGLCFVVTWDLDWVPRQGERVVVFLIGDEMCQTPSYAGRVRAVFKTGGVQPFRPFPLLSRPKLCRFLALLRDMRDCSKRLRRLSKTRHVNSEVRGTIFPVPLGYHKQIDVPMVSILKRKNDVFFAGTIPKPPSLLKPSSWPWRPRSYSRYCLAREIVSLRRSHPHVACNAALSSDGSSAPLGPVEYSSQLADSKICFVPRGNFWETFRFFEGARAGCILISEPLPQLWYYEDHPAMIVESWHNLAELIEWILSSSQRVEELHAKSKTWWRDKASEPAVARYVVDRLEGLLAQEPASKKAG
jgi:hypothetical protein